jgi:hypothetical protein
MHSMKWASASATELSRAACVSPVRLCASWSAVSKLSGSAARPAAVSATSTPASLQRIAGDA